MCPAADASAPPYGSEPDLDPLDVLLDGAIGERALQESSAGSFAVGVEAMLRVSSQDRTTFGAFAFVQIPFARLAAPPRRALAPVTVPDRAAALALQPFAGPPRIGPARAEIAPSPGTPAPDSAPAPAPAPAPVVAPAPTLTGDLARGAVRAACKAAGLDAAEARLDSLASRARSSALLPELRLRATRAIDESESLSPTEYDPLRRTASGGTSTWLEARATFRLDRLVFADDELAVERLRLSRASERARLVTRVLELLDAWQRARAVEADPAESPDARRRAILAASAAEASLDVLTGGWFSKAIAAPADGASGPAGAPDASPPPPGTAPASTSPAGGATAGASPSTPPEPSTAPDANERTRDAKEHPQRAAAQDAGAVDTSRATIDVSHDAAHPSPTWRGASRKM